MYCCLSLVDGRVSLERAHFSTNKSDCNNQTEFVANYRVNSFICLQFDCLIIIINLYLIISLPNAIKSSNYWQGPQHPNIYLFNS